MGTVTISGSEYTIYGTYAGATTYWIPMLGPAADKWAISDMTTRSKALVMAYNLLERQVWLDSVSTFALRDAIAAFPKASYELAAALLLDSSLYSAEMSGKNIKSVGGAGVPTVEFFVPTLGISGRFPVNIQELIGKYLMGAEGGSVSGSFSSGTDGKHTPLDGNVTTASDYDLTRGLS